MTETTIQPQNKNAKPTTHSKMLFKTREARRGGAHL